MLITDREINILQNRCGEMIRCDGCDELIISACVFAHEEMDDETPKVVALHRYFEACEHCGVENHTTE
ncbi:hypothetical protein DRN34_04690 [Thermococci archaeon]|nr:MAG: hypothetical protein DRN34_04690 [Thermococci archaeon]